MAYTIHGIYRKGLNLTYHDINDDNLITLEPGDEVTIVSPSGSIVVGNRSTNTKGKLTLWVRE